MRGSWVDPDPAQGTEDRRLQGSEALTTLTMSFQRCVFEVSAHKHMTGGNVAYIRDASI